MTDISRTAFDKGHRGNWIRLRTMILLRWGAISGQLSALLFAHYVYDLSLPMGLCIMVVGISILSNLAATFIFPQSKRLHEAENLSMVTFDLLQLGLLLFLTGGLNNPFSILIVGPVTVSATALSLRPTIFVGTTAIIVVSLLLNFHVPLRNAQGDLLQVAQMFQFGNWVAITIAILFLGVYSRWITNEMNAMSDALQATHLALARAQQLTDMGGVVAAAAHELGTPLATIKLASGELIDELQDQPGLIEDARLIRDQADRCRDILRSMGRAGKDDLHLRQAPLGAVVREAAEPHGERGKLLHFVETPEAGFDGPQPSILRRPEIVHGLRNLVQNAVDFSHRNVWIVSHWTQERITVRIMDDGEGFPPQMIGRIGDPYVAPRRTDRFRRQRPEYEGMGLGLFIAKTLLERSGAELSFANGADSQAVADSPAASGAIVETVWPRAKIDALTGDHAVPTAGQNIPFDS